MRARRGRRTIEATPPAHLLGPGETLPTGRDRLAALDAWLRAEGLAWYGPEPIPRGLVDPLALLVESASPEPVTWFDFVTRYTRPAPPTH